MSKVKVGILGATGMVGQRFVQLLANHPWFEVAELAASERSAGRSYAEVMEGRWKIAAGIPEPTYSLVTSVEGMTIDSATGLIEWTAAEGNLGFNTVTVQAANSAGADSSVST